MTKRWYAFIAMLPLFMGCHRRPLVEKSDDIQINISLQINTIINITTEIYNELIPVPDIHPEMMRVMFFDPATNQLVTQAFIKNQEIDADGNQSITGSIKIRPGVYDMLCYNFDTSSTLIRNEYSWNTIESYTDEISDEMYARFGYTRAEPFHIAYEPDHLLVAREPRLEIKPSSKTIVIKTNAQTVVDSYYVQIRLKNAQFASSASAVLTGMSPSNKFALNERNYTDPSGVFFEMQRSTDLRQRQSESQDVLCATFSTFGKIPESDSHLNITFNIITVDGKKVERTYDMNEVFKTEDAIKRHWLLIDDEIEIPKPDQPEGGGGGFNPGVNDWEEEEGEIEI